MSHKARHISSRWKRPPASGRAPKSYLASRDLALVADELQAFHRGFRSVFQRREQWEWSVFYLCGQLSDLERKTIEPMVLALLGANPNAIRGLQQFIGQGGWAAPALVIRQQQRVAEWLGDPEATVIVDGSGFPKQGQHSAGVAHQYCGRLGKVANCQEGVFAVYASAKGYAFLDGRLYLPQDWFGDEHRERRQRCEIPETTRFQTEPELGLGMLQELVTRNVLPFRWVAADEVFGRDSAFLDGVAELEKWYLVEVPSDTRVWLQTPPIEPPGAGPLGRPRTRPRVARNAPSPIELRVLVQRLSWRRLTIQEGSKGTLVAEFAFVRVTAIRDDLPGPRVWAVFRRRLGPKPECKYYLSNAPARIDTRALAHQSGRRWPIETALEEAKGEAGMADYETRTWRGWYHHMAQTFLAHLFLMRLRLRFKKAPALTTAQARQLVARVLADDFRPSDTLAIIAYRQRRNHAAYCSHRKRTCQRHRRQ